MLLLNSFVLLPAFQKMLLSKELQNPTYPMAGRHARQDRRRQLLPPSHTQGAQAGVRGLGSSYFPHFSLTLPQQRSRRQLLI